MGTGGTDAEIPAPGADYLTPNAGQRCLAPAVDPKQCGANLSGENTEFHSYRALWLARQQSAASPYAEKQAELFVSTDKTAAGKEADCAHRNRPANFSLPQAGTDAPTFSTYYLTYPPGYQQCLMVEPNWQDVSGHYSFLLAAPPGHRAPRGWSSTRLTTVRARTPPPPPLPRKATRCG